MHLQNAGRCIGNLSAGLAAYNHEEYHTAVTNAHGHLQAAQANTAARTTYDQAHWVSPVIPSGHVSNCACTAVPRGEFDASIIPVVLT